MNNPRKLSEIVEILRDPTYSRSDEQGSVLLCLECEEWTWVEINLASGLLDFLGDIIVENIDIDDNKARLWIKTNPYNCPEV